MPEPKLPDDLVLALGRVTVNGMRLEADIVLHSWTQRNLNTTRVGAKGEPTDNFSDCLKKLKQWVRANLRGNAMTQTLSVLYEIRNVMDERNVCVHGLWSARPVKGAAHSVRGLRNGADAGFYSSAQLHDLADRVHVARAHLMNVTVFLELPLVVAGRETTRVAVSAEESAVLGMRPEASGIAWPR